jgi:uncharacterized protein YggU (UPF0235/DUF167 family)
MYIKVIVTAGAKEEGILRKSSDHFEISVREKAERNMANKKVIELLSHYFRVSTGRIRIINGHQHPHKLLVVDSKL